MNNLTQVFSKEKIGPDQEGSVPSSARSEPGKVPEKVIMVGDQGYVSLKAAARILGINPKTMYKWAETGEASSGVSLDLLEDRLKVRQKPMISLKCLETLKATRFQKKTIPGTTPLP